MIVLNYDDLVSVKLSGWHFEKSSRFEEEEIFPILIGLKKNFIIFYSFLIPWKGITRIVGNWNFIGNIQKRGIWKKFF